MYKVSSRKNDDVSVLKNTGAVGMDNDGDQQRFSRSKYLMGDRSSDDDDKGEKW